MAFQFPLATVLRLRIMIEEREEGLLQKILLNIAGVFADIERIDVQLEECEALRHADTLKPHLGLHLHASYGEIKQLKERRQECEVQLQKLEAERDVQVTIYESARRDREMLSDMREEKRMAYEAEATKREQRILDDTYIARRGRGI